MQAKVEGVLKQKQDVVVRYEPLPSVFIVECYNNNTKEFSYEDF